MPSKVVDFSQYLQQKEKLKEEKEKVEEQEKESIQSEITVENIIDIVQKMVCFRNTKNKEKFEVFKREMYNVLYQEFPELYDKMESEIEQVIKRATTDQMIEIIDAIIRAEINRIKSSRNDFV
jgi:dsDNA-specific endonuclease/ATPase MutS2